MIKQIGIGLGMIVLFLLVFIGLQFFGVWNVEFFGAKYAAAEREVWEETPSRVHGATQEITQRMREYHNTNSSEEKKAICQFLNMQYSNFNPDLLDNHRVREFFEMCVYTGG